MPLSSEQRKEIIDDFPFPLAYTYQNLLVQHNEIEQTLGFSENHQQREWQSQEFLWNLLRNYRLLLRLVTVIAIENYLHNRHKLSDPKVNAILWRHLSVVTEQGWYKMVQTLLKHFTKQPSSSTSSSATRESWQRLVEFQQLAQNRILIEQNPPAAFPTQIQPEQPYSWLELMSCFAELQQHLRDGCYRLDLPEQDILNYYFVLLETALLACAFLKEYNIYVLVGKDERKTRGFLCRGNKSNPVGIRGISQEKWQAFKGKPLLAQRQQKGYISLFPLLVPLLQKYQERTGFSDLLLLEHHRVDKVMYLAYRQNKLIEHRSCALAALAMLQKELRWLELSAQPSSLSLQPLAATFFPSLTQKLPEREEFFVRLWSALHNNRCAYLFLESPPGSGKSTTLQQLRQHHLKQGNWENVRWGWYFCGSFFPQSEPENIFRSLYQQILREVYQEAEEEIELRSQRLSPSLEDLAKSLGELLERASEEILVPQNTKLVVVIDGLDELPTLPITNRLLHLLPRYLPLQVYFLVSANLNNAQQTSSPLHQLLTNTIDWSAAIVRLAPLAGLTEQQFAAWIDTLSLPATIDREDLLQEPLLAKAAGGDLLYLQLLFSGLEKSYLNRNTITWLPMRQEQLFFQIWQHLPGHKNLLSYKIFILLACLRTPGQDELLSQILEVPVEEITSARQPLNIFLRYSQQYYTLFHHQMIPLVQTQLAPQDYQWAHRLLAQHYECMVDGERDYKKMSNEGLLFLSYHHRQAGNYQALNAIAQDNQFKDEKVKRFKSYNSYLQDIQQAQEESLKRSEWLDLLEQSYRFCEVNLEASQGVARMFRYAENGNYDLALERVRGIRDEHDLFKALLLILWQAIDQQQVQEAYLVVEELDQLPDDRVSYATSGLDELLVLLITKLDKLDFFELEPILYKHGLKGNDSLEYLLKLHSRLQVSEATTLVFVALLLFATDEMFSAQEKLSAFHKILGIIPMLQEAEESKQIWDSFLHRVFSLEDLQNKLNGLLAIAEKLALWGRQDYLLAVADKITEEVEALEKPGAKSLAAMKLAVLFHILDNDKQCQRYMESSLRYALRLKELAKVRHLFAKLVSYLEKIEPYEEHKGFWKKIIAVVRQQPATAYQDKLLAQLVLSLARLQQSETAFSLLTEEISLKPEHKAQILINLAEVWAENPTSCQEKYWDFLLDQTRFLVLKQHKIAILKAVVPGLLHLGIAPHQGIWKKYWLACDLLKDSDDGESKEALYAETALQLIDYGWLKEANEIIVKLSSPRYRALPLAQLALVSIENGAIKEALHIVEEISDLREAYRIYHHLLVDVSSQQVSQFWTRLATAMANTNQMEVGRVALDDLQGIAQLFIEVYFEESQGFWEEIFMAARKLPSDQEKKQWLEFFLELLTKNLSYERCNFLWPLLREISQQLHSFATQAEVGTAMAQALVHFGQLAEAQHCLEQAVFFTQKERHTHSALLALVKVLVVYREMGNERLAHDTFEEILQKSGIEENRKVKQCQPYEIVVALADEGAGDMGKLLIEKMLLNNVKTGEESISPALISQVVHLCLQADRLDWARHLFFQTLPALPKEQSKSIAQEPHFYYVIAMLRAISEYDSSLELWEQTEAMLLNFHRVSEQERFLDAFAQALAECVASTQAQELWKKLMQDARYIGQEIDASKSVLQAGKWFLKVFSWSEFYSSWEFVWHNYENLTDDEKRLELFRYILLLFQHDSSFHLSQPEWKKVQEQPIFWREDCKNYAYLEIVKLLVHKAKSNPEFFEQAENYLQRITKKQQFCEAALLLLSSCSREEYEKQGRKLQQQILEKGEELDHFYQNRILPELGEYLIAVQAYQDSYEVIQKIQDQHLRVQLSLTSISKLAASGETRQAKKLLSPTLPLIAKLSPESGENIKMAALAAKCLLKIDGLPVAKRFLEKSLSSWSSILNASYQKETISYLVKLLENFPYQPQIIETWEKISQLAQEIEQETYRAWALQEIAEIHLHHLRLAKAFEVLKSIPPIREVKIRLLGLYGEKLAEHSPQEIWPFLETLSLHEKQDIASKIAKGMSQNQDLLGLYRLLVEVPGNFTTTSLLGIHILELVLEQEGAEKFEQICRKLVAAWKL